MNCVLKFAVLACCLGSLCECSRIKDLPDILSKRQTLEKCSMKCEPIEPSSKPPKPSSESPPPSGSNMLGSGAPAQPGSPSGPVNIFLCPNGLSSTMGESMMGGINQQPQMGGSCGASPPEFKPVCQMVNEPLQRAPSCGAPAPHLQMAPQQPICLPPQPVCQAPQPVYQAPQPVCPAPQSVCKAPQPVCKAPKPVCAAPQPVYALPQPVFAQPVCAAQEPFYHQPASHLQHQYQGGSSDEEYGEPEYKMPSGVNTNIKAGHCVNSQIQLSMNSNQKDRNSLGQMQGTVDSSASSSKDGGSKATVVCNCYGSEKESPCSQEHTSGKPSKPSLSETSKAPATPSASPVYNIHLHGMPKESYEPAPMPQAAAPCAGPKPDPFVFFFTHPGNSGQQHGISGCQQQVSANMDVLKSDVQEFVNEIVKSHENYLRYNAQKQSFSSMNCGAPRPQCPC